MPRIPRSPPADATLLHPYYLPSIHLSEDVYPVGKKYRTPTRPLLFISGVPRPVKRVKPSKPQKTKIGRNRLAASNTYNKPATITNHYATLVLHEGRASNSGDKENAFSFSIQKSSTPSIILAPPSPALPVPEPPSIPPFLPVALQVPILKSKLPVETEMSRPRVSAVESYASPPGEGLPVTLSILGPADWCIKPPKLTPPAHAQCVGLGIFQENFKTTEALSPQEAREVAGCMSPRTVVQNYTSLDANVQVVIDSIPPRAPSECTITSQRRSGFKSKFGTRMSMFFATVTAKRSVVSHSDPRSDLLL